MNLQIVQIYKKNAIQASFFTLFCRVFPQFHCPLKTVLKAYECSAGIRLFIKI